MYQLGWFSTGRDEAARDLLEAVRNSIRRGEIEAGIALVFCTREPGESPDSDLFIRQVEDYGIPLICYSYQKFRASRDTGNGQPGELPSWRLDYDREVMKRLAAFQPDLCVLAGYMLIVEPEMCRRYHMINLHPAAPGGPAGTWQEVIWQLMDSRAAMTGVMMHLVIQELDKGPPATFCTFSIQSEPFDRYWQELEKLPPGSPERRSQDNPLFKLIRRYGLAREFPLIIATIKAFSQDKVSIKNGKIVDAGGKPIRGYDLTEEIDRAVGKEVGGD